MQPIAPKTTEQITHERNEIAVGLGVHPSQLREYEDGGWVWQGMIHLEVKEPAIKGFYVVVASAKLMGMPIGLLDPSNAEAGFTYRQDGYTGVSETRLALAAQAAIQHLRLSLECCVNTMQLVLNKIPDVYGSYS